MARRTQRHDPNEISYRWVPEAEKISSTGEFTHRVLASHQTEGIVGLLNVTNEHWPRGGARGRGKFKSGGRGLKVGLVHVDPEFQKRGIGTAMYNIATRQLGYAPEHDTVRTKEGSRFAQSVSGGRTGTPGERVAGGNIPVAHQMPSWGQRINREDMQRIQSPVWMRGEKVDQTWSNAMTPRKTTARRKLMPEQLELPGMPPKPEPVKAKPGANLRSKRMQTLGPGTKV